MSDSIFRRYRGELLSAAAAVLIVMLLAAIYGLASLPVRGYTVAGLVFGFLAAGMILFAAAYSLRKRSYQEKLPGRMQVWLWLHVAVTLALLAAVLFHSGFHIEGRAGTWALGVLLLALLSGLGGWIIYLRLPTVASAKVGNLAAGATEKDLAEIDRFIAGARAGRENEPFGQRIAELETGSANMTLTGMSEADVALVLRIGDMMQQRSELRRRLERQRQIRRWLRGWLWLHIPAAVLVIPVTAFHAIEALGLHQRVLTTPHSFASPETCKGCHPLQYDEWIGSMHAIAQSSPVTDLQTRLVLEKDYREVALGAAKGGRDKLLVGPLCEACHAPTGTLTAVPSRPKTALPPGNAATASLFAFSEHQNPLINIEDRAPASRFGVSCATCHSIANLQRGDDKDMPYRNVENLWFRAGRQYFGPFGSGSEGDESAVGNAYHESSFLADLNDPEFCASCHSVLVHDVEKNGQPVKLQDTFQEWRNPPTPPATINWSQSAARHCLNCHGKDLQAAVDKAKSLQAQRAPLQGRTQTMAETIEKLREAGGPTAAAAKGIDGPATRARRFNHSFVGVDYHLEKGLPILGKDNKDVQDKTFKKVENLLSIATAIRLDDEPFCEQGKLCVSVSNLATGHKFPAGFAFARESWVEVAVSEQAEGERWRVLVGGSKNLEVLSGEDHLDKCENGPKDCPLKNFQFVLFNEKGGTRRETVLQNEVTEVLKGKGAREQGFFDRQDPLQPGEVRPLRISIPGGYAAMGDVQRIRVRFLFRNLPPAFMDQLAERFDELGDADKARRSRKLKESLRIVEMARDCWPNAHACGALP